MTINDPLDPAPTRYAVIRLTDGADYYVAGGGGGADHNLLSATHLDTLVAAALRGSILIGNATPVWARTALGVTGTVLRSDGLDALWATLAHADLGSVTADQHHPEVHTHAHTHGSHSGIGTDDHHAQLHEAAHRSAGGDPLSVLNLAGFPGGTSNFLRADATFAAPPGGGGGISVIDREMVTIDVVNTVTETVVFTHQVAAGSMGTNGILRLTLIGDALFNNVTTNTLTIRCKFGGTTWYADTDDFAAAISASRHPMRIALWIGNKDSASVQFCGGQWMEGTAGGATTGLGDASTDEVGAMAPFASNGTLAINTGLAQTFEVTVQWSAASANNSFRRMFAVLELL